MHSCNIQNIHAGSTRVNIILILRLINDPHAGHEEQTLLDKSRKRFTIIMTKLQKNVKDECKHSEKSKNQ